MIVSWVCGRIDYQRVLQGQKPRFARVTWVITDGGTFGCQGFGYFLVRVHTMMENLSEDPADRGKHKTGVRLSYQLRCLYPSIVDLRSDQKQVEVTQE
jgi:hypothetical protein